MASTYDPLLRLELQATGENINTWGEKTNTNLELLADSIAGFTSISIAGSGDYTLTTSNGATDQARSAIITLTGLLTGNRAIIVPSSSKTYIFRNATTGSYAVTVKTAGGTAATLPQGYVLLIACDGTDCFDASEVARVSKAGDTMTGPLVLPGNPTVALQAAPKQYVDATAAAAASALIPSGTAMLFAQTAAPTGWTKVTTHNNKALRVVSGTASSGGSVAFSTAFASKTVSGTVGDTALTTAQMPVHAHTNNPTGGNVAYANQGAFFIFPAGTEGGNYIGYGGINSTDTAGSGQTHTHTFTGTAINLAVQYVDVIIATKD